MLSGQTLWPVEVQPFYTLSQSALFIQSCLLLPKWELLISSTIAMTTPKSAVFWSDFWQATPQNTLDTWLLSTSLLKAVLSPQTSHSFGLGEEVVREGGGACLSLKKKKKRKFSVCSQLVDNVIMSLDHLVDLAWRNGRWCWSRGKKMLPSKEKLSDYSNKQTRRVDKKKKKGNWGKVQQIKRIKARADSVAEAD